MVQLVLLLPQNGRRVFIVGNHVRTTHCDCNRNGKGDGAASELYTRWRPIWGQCLTVEVLPGAEPV